MTTNITPEKIWDEGFEAGATWSPSNPGPSGIPLDPPLNPYNGTTTVLLSPDPRNPAHIAWTRDMIAALNRAHGEAENVAWNTDDLDRIYDQAQSEAVV